MSVNSIVGVTFVFGLINNIAITAFFGLNREVDAYFAGFMLVNLFIVLVVDFLGKNFLPLYAARREISRESASELTSLVVTQVGLLSLVVSFLLAMLADRLFTLLLPGFDEQGILLVTATFTVMAPCIALRTINAFHEYVWQHGERYSRVVSARLFVPGTLTVAIVGFGEDFGPQVLPYGFLIGNVLSTAILAVGIPYRYSPRFNYRDRDFRKILKNSGLLMSTGFIARSRNLVVQFFASQLGEGAISAVAIATKLCQPVFQTALLGIRMILFSRSARAVAQGNVALFASMHDRALAGMFFLTMPIAGWYVYHGETIVRALFQRGAFTDDMVFLVDTALLGYAGLVAFSGGVQMLSNAFYSLDRVFVPAIVNPVATIVFLGIAVLLTPSFGLLGLTSASSIITAIVFFVMLAWLKAFVEALSARAIMIAMLRYGLAGILASASSAMLLDALELSLYARFALSVILLGALYVAVVLLSGDTLLRQLYTKARGRVA